MSDKNYRLVPILFVIIALCTLPSCNSSIPDGKIQDDIAQKLNAAGIENLSVVVQHGAVTITGQVPNVALRNQTEVLVKSVEGVKSIQNSVVVITPMPEPANDPIQGPEVATDEEVESPSLESEAYDIAQKFADKTVTKCGGSYFFGTNAGTVYECKNAPSITLDGKTYEPRELSQADKLNNVDPFPVEWEGFARIELAVCRHYNKGFGGYDSNNKFRESWGQWHDYSEKLVLNLKKTKGKWTQDQEQGTIQAKHYNVVVSCSDVANINKKLSGQSDSAGSNDISETYGKVGNVIFNKKTMTVFMNPAEFFKDSGKKSFDGLKYDGKSSLPTGLKFMDGRKLTDDDYKKLR